MWMYKRHTCVEKQRKREGAQKERGRRDMSNLYEHSIATYMTTSLTYLGHPWKLLEGWNVREAVINQTLSTLHRWQDFSKKPLKLMNRTVTKHLHKKSMHMQCGYIHVIVAIGVHEMHVRMHPNKVLQLLCWPMTPFHHWPTVWSTTPLR